MAFLGLCPGDTLTTTLREVFGANIVRVPEERIQPLCVIASMEGRSKFRGALAPLVSGQPELAFDPTHVIDSQMADVSGKRSRKVNLELGLRILEGFLQGFGVPSAGVSARLQGASEVSFSFRNVRRRYVDNNWLGRVLAGRVIDRNNPAAEIFFGEDGYSFLVVDSVITSSDFSISVERTAAQGFNLDVPAIQTLVAQAKAGVEVTTSSGFDLIFQGEKSLSFAFSCVRLYLNKAGKITSMPPEFDVVLDRGLLPSMTGHELLYSPDRVLLSEKPGLMAWDE
jgi:hypothetical protein